ncbi:hypothetical protein QQZ08_009279 [Neonectria magnoliae]|uniref:Uncharacterized protein n=1 Tax=Neonectria magnoliae TaxID=2732573 RepID=A0ABR1HP16_9HYPO
MIRDLGSSRGRESEDVVHHLRVATFLNSQIVMAGSQADVDVKGFPHTVGEYNFLVVWSLCLPSGAFERLKVGPWSRPRFRAEMADPSDPDDMPSVYKLLMNQQEKGVKWTKPEIGAEMAGQILDAIETTSSALAFIFCGLAKNQSLLDSLYRELEEFSNTTLENAKLLDACVTEGLRFRPPVALTGSRVAPREGLDVLGCYIPEGTVVITQFLSMSRRRPDLFPNLGVFDPTRWLDEDRLQERRKLTAPFGLGAQRCPGGNMAIDQMRLILAAVIRSFTIEVAPETTPESMTPFEANGFRSRYDECCLLFQPREQ